MTAVAARILLVDDNKSGLAARKAVLEEMGHRVMTASGAEDALEIFARGGIHVLVTDYRMPRIDGVELIRRVREVQAEIPVILLSGYVEALGLSESNTGADIVIAKSANEITHLLRAVSRLLRRKPARKPPAKQQRTLRAKRAGV